MKLKVMYKSCNDWYDDQERVFIGKSKEILKKLFYEFTVWLFSREGSSFKIIKVQWVDRDKGIEEEIEEKEWIEWL